MRMLSVNGKLPNCTFRIIKKMVPVLPVLTWQWLFMASVSTTLQHRVQLMDPKLFMHVVGRPRTVPTVLRGTLSLMFVMHHTSTITLLPLAQMPIHDGETGMMTTLWDINYIHDWAGHAILVRFLGEFNSWVLRTFHLLFTNCLTFPWHLPPVGVWLFVFLALLVVFLFVCFLVLQVSRDFTIPPRVLDLDDRQGFTARSALR